MDARWVARETKAMTRKEVMVRAIAGRLTWIAAADILGVTPRHMRRLRQLYEQSGYDGLVDHRGGKSRRKRIPTTTIGALCRLRREQYPDFSIQHFWEHATEKHGFALSYTWTLQVLRAAGLAPRAVGRGKYRRTRERRPVIGMLVHLDASTHRWLPGVAPQDLVVALDDADGRILYARFWPQEGTASTFAAVHHVLTQCGRFAELYTDRGSHFCRTTTAGAAPDLAYDTQVQRALKVLGIRHILARSPEARGRSERAFGTLQGRLPQELRAAGITDYAAANGYLTTTFVPDFNRRFTVPPTERGSAFLKLVGIDLRLVLSSHHDRVVANDSTVRFGPLTLQLPKLRLRRHYVRCPVLVHEFPDNALGISYQGRLLARYDRQGTLLEAPTAKGKAA
jgi:transposase InsO family protein